MLHIIFNELNENVDYNCFTKCFEVLGKLQLEVQPTLFLD